MIWIAVGAVLLFLAGVVYLAVYQRWEVRHAAGMAYFGQPSVQRQARKRKITLTKLRLRLGAEVPDSTRVPGRH